MSHEMDPKLMTMHFHFPRAALWLLFAALAAFCGRWYLRQRELARFYTLDDRAEKAVMVGDLVNATRYARELLLLAPKYHRDHEAGWHYGNAVHDGNNILGLVALAQGNIGQAKRYLLEAGRTPGSPQLAVFGPSMVLARALLRRGERESVIDYIRLSGRYWKNDDTHCPRWPEPEQERTRCTAQHVIRNWTEVIDKGGYPDFRNITF